MYNINGLTVELLTVNDNKITEFPHNGLYYVEGRKNSKYKIRVQNNTGNRIKAIISVDGLDIINGKRATPSSPGYVIRAFETQVFEGWRISDTAVREFVFTSIKNSYNAKTKNDTNNVGVIGVMAYKELTYRDYSVGVAYPTPASSWGHYNIHPTSSLNINNTLIGSGNTNIASFLGYSQAVNASYSAAQQIRPRGFSVGTGMGEEKASKVEKVSSSWATEPYAVCQLFYKSRKELEAIGIVVARPSTLDSPLPKAFEGYCRQV